MKPNKRLQFCRLLEQFDYFGFLHIRFLSGLEKRITTFGKIVTLIWQGWQESDLRIKESKSFALPLGHTPVSFFSRGHYTASEKVCQRFSIFHIRHIRH